MSEANLRRVSELALIGIASIWGLTFVMVKDAIEELPTMAFPAGWRAGAVMGVFLAGGYIFQTLGMENTTASNAGFITGLFVVFTPVLGALLLRDRLPGTVWATDWS